MADSFTVPQAVRDAAKRGLELRRKYGRGGLDTRQAKEEGVGSGVQRASNLMQGKVSYETIKRMKAFFARHEKNKDSRTESGEPGAGMISWEMWGGDAGKRWAERIVRQVEAAKSFGDLVDLYKAAKRDPKVPAKYLEGLTGKEREKRKKQIQDRMSGKTSGYKELEGDDAKTKESKYSKTKIAEKVRDEVKKPGKAEFLRAASKVSGVSRQILEEVYDRGLKAWSSGGHRPGATAQQWAIARVYSFISNGKARKTADKDLWERHSKGE